MDFSKENKHG